MTKTLGFGILGAGLIAPFHARAVRDAKGSKLIAVCDQAHEELSPPDTRLSKPPFSMET